MMIKLCLAVLTLGLAASPVMAEEVGLHLRHQQETSQGSGRYHRLTRQESWDPKQTAVIVCDVWDLHHSRNAVERVQQLAPRLNELLKECRRRGMTIIHAPSDCMQAYQDHPARRRAVETPRPSEMPDDIQSWCSIIPAEESAVYPIDQSDGGDDDDPQEHAAWAAKLKKMGRNVGTPWEKQYDVIEIDAEKDFISDRGEEVWGVLKDRGVKNVLLTGVHTNMCVLGRPFGLRQMAKNGMNTALVRDLTDTMYNPARWPYVSHFTGTDLIVSHIEKYVCPTITSDQLLGGEPFRFKEDDRPHIVVVMAEDEYQTNQTLPPFATKQLGKKFRVTLVYGDEQQRNVIVGLETLKDADAALFSVRRRTLRPEQMKIVKEFVASGKPVIGIRTASHAFSLRRAEPPEGLADWRQFDAEVFGGNYTNHYGNKLASTITIADGAKDHPILAGMSREPFTQGGSLYKTSPLAAEAEALLMGKVEGHPAEPVAWTFRRKDGGRSFYTSMGHPDDFQNPQFIRLLTAGVCWAAEVSPPVEPTIDLNDAQSKHWSLIDVPMLGESAPASGRPGPAWQRCALRLSETWVGDNVIFELPHVNSGATVWLNGHKAEPRPDQKRGSRFLLERDWIEMNDANLLVVRLESRNRGEAWQAPPRIYSDGGGVSLAGRWQFRIGDDPSWSNIPLPARYGASTDVVFVVN